eukprot:CAMPEP_0197030330 /NCGR_PEP_ID=MMETSP1384-20130603/9588_1 /TAXON_ID=29189 /ORGANISM="Ammonia sp." /LENGTH=470 /DNA_ID=CAMNT_0042459653 /DNA_START=51 /DNA_END=1463 /DNA_ORIENTATION=-
MADVQKSALPMSINSVPTKYYYSIYALALAFDGFICTFPAAIYVELQTRLNTSVLIISWIYTAMSIGYILGNVACGYLTDHIKEAHRLQSAILFACGIAVICVPFTSNIQFIFALFTIIGAGMASNETHYTIFIFRLYPADGVTMYFWCVVIFDLFAILSASSIQFSLSLTGTDLYAFVIFGGIAIVHSIAILFVETPKHDEYRAIKRRASSLPKDACAADEVMDDGFFAEAAATKLKLSSTYQRLQNVTITLLLFGMSLHAMTLGGFLSFSTVYCRDYLHIDDKYGRYFIMSFWSGGLVVLFLRQLLVSNSSPVLAVVISNILRCVLQVVFIALSKVTNAAPVYLVLYALCGATSGMNAAALCSWAELIRPTTGLIACLFWVFYGVGSATMMLSMGELTERYGAKWIPFIICVPLFVAAVVNAIAVTTYKMIQKQESIAFEEVKQPSIDTDTDSEFEGATDTETVPPPA